MPRNQSAPVKTPGVVDQSPKDDSVETDIDKLADDAPDLDSGADEPAPAKPAKDQKVSLTVKELQDLVAAEVAKAVQAQRPAAATVNEPAVLPDQKDIDPDKITRPTLSAQGYVVPTGYGNTPEPSNKRS